VAEPEKPSRLRSLLSALIALTAVTGALVSWQASRIGGQASGADSKAVTTALDEAAVEMEIAATTFSNVTDVREYVLHEENAKALLEEAKRNADAPSRWIRESQSESIRAHARHTQLDTDYLKSVDGRPEFESERYRETTRALMASERPLNAEPFIKAAEERRREALFLVLLNVAFTAAIFLFTVALKTNVRRKPVWTAAGAAIYLAAAVTAAVRIFG
jgi:hypothetical protein